MKSMFLKAYSVGKELDLNKIAEFRGIPKRYTWEEPLILEDKNLKEILQTEAPIVEVSEDQRVYLFSFGSAVFVNMNLEYVNHLIRFLHKTMPGIDIEKCGDYSDDYEVRIENEKVITSETINEEKEPLITFDYITLGSCDKSISEVIATVIAKSVALERIEYNLGKILDRIEGVIDSLEKGGSKIMMAGKSRITRLMSEVARHEYNTISYIMILDKPDITWVNEYAGDVYNEMSEMFELNDRFEILRQKTEIINSIIDNFSSMTNNARGLFVEWVIVALIVIEVVMAIWEKI